MNPKAQPFSHQQYLRILKNLTFNPQSVTQVDNWSRSYCMKKENQRIEGIWIHSSASWDRSSAMLQLLFVITFSQQGQAGAFVTPQQHCHPWKQHLIGSNKHSLYGTPIPGQSPSTQCQRHTTPPADTVPAADTAWPSPMLSERVFQAKLTSLIPDFFFF